MSLNDYLGRTMLLILPYIWEMWRLIARLTCLPKATEQESDRTGLWISDCLTSEFFAPFTVVANTLPRPQSPLCLEGLMLDNLEFSFWVDPSDLCSTISFVSSLTCTWPMSSKLRSRKVNWLAQGWQAIQCSPRTRAQVSNIHPQCV